MAAKCDLTIAYNGYAIGGESAIAQPLDEIRLKETYYRKEVECPIIVVQTTQSLMSSEIVSIEAALKAKSKNLGITSGERIMATDGVANNTTTFTSAVGGFASGDVGLPINIEGRGAYQIVTVNSANSAILSASVTTGTGLTWRVGYVLLQVTPSLNTQGGFVRCELDKIGSPDHDSGLSRKLIFRAGHERPADNTNDGYRREAQVALAYSGSRQRTVTFTGQYTSGGGNTALANYLTNSAAWIATRLTEISGAATFEKISEPTVYYDDERQVLNFTTVYREILFAQDLRVTDNASIVRDVIAFRRTGVWVHGKDGGSIAAVRAHLSYACEVDSTVTTATGLKALYTDTIKPFLISKVQTLIGGTVLIESEDTSFDPSTNAIASMLQVTLVGLGSDVLLYEETVSYSLDQQLVFRKVWDGQQDTFHYFSPGHRIAAARTVTTETFGGGSGGGSSGGGGGGVAGINLFSNQGAFGGINPFGGAEPAATSKKGGDSSDLWRQKPPDRFGAAANGSWINTSDQDALGPMKFIGHDIDGQGQVRPVFRTQSTQTYVWVSAAAPTRLERIQSGLTSTGGNQQSDPTTGPR